MAYTKREWENGEIITAAKLNNMEDGIEANDQAIGDLTDLDTTAKTDLVAAVNELAGDVDDLSDEMGDDVSALKSQLGATGKGAVRNFDALVDYNYSADAEFVVGSGTGAAGMGVIRQGCFVTLNTNAATGGVRIKLSGEVVRVAASGSSANAAVDAWTGITLIPHHRYRASALFLSGTATGDTKAALVIYEEGSHASIGTKLDASDANNYYREFIYNSTPINVVLTAPSGSTYTNATFLVVIEDLTETFSKKYEGFKDSARALSGSIDYLYSDGYSLMPGTSLATDIDIDQSGEVVRMSGTNNAGSLMKIKITNGLARTIQNNVVSGWTGVDLEVGHTYKIVSTLIDGAITYTDPNQVSGIPVSAYRNGESSTVGSASGNERGQYIRTFTADVTNYTLVVTIPVGATLDSAVFAIVLTDITEIHTDADDFREVADVTRLYTKGNEDRDVGQSLVVVDGKLYIYNSYPESSPSIKVVNLTDGTEQTVSLNLGHGNGMTYRDGYIYACGMGSSGIIYKVDISTLTIADQYVFSIDGTPVVTYGIGYNHETDQFILECSDKYAVCDTSFVLDHIITRSITPSGTKQGLGCDENYIFEIRSDPNFIYVFKYDGTFVCKVGVESTDEMENLFYDGEGGYYLITNVPYLGYYVDAIQLYNAMSMNSLKAFSRLFGKIPY